MELRDWGSRTRVIILAVTTSKLRCTERGISSMASQFCSCWLSGGQFEEISGIGRVTEMTVEPPLIEGVMGERRYRSIVER